MVDHLKTPKPEPGDTTIDDRYKIVREIGKGAAGTVYEGVQLSVDRRVAVKILHRSNQSRKDYSERFTREAKAIARLSHTNCITLHDFGYSEEFESLYMVMEFVDGVELYELIKKQPLPFRRALKIAIQIAEALSHAHKHGILHRDLKPENVLVTSDDDVKVLDFGLARMLDPFADENGRRLTAEGAIFGTPAYMSPEQCSGDMDVTVHSDIYALGVMMYQLFQGELPFRSKEVFKILSEHAKEPPPPITAPIPARLVKLILRMLEKKKTDRPHTANEVADTLRAVLLGLAIDDGAIMPDVSQEIQRSLLGRELGGRLGAEVSSVSLGSEASLSTERRGIGESSSSVDTQGDRTPGTDESFGAEISKPADRSEASEPLEAAATDDEGLEKTNRLESSHPEDTSQREQSRDPTNQDLDADLEKTNRLESSDPVEDERGEHTNRLEATDRIDSEVIFGKPGSLPADRARTERTLPAQLDARPTMEDPLKAPAPRLDTIQLLGNQIGGKYDIVAELGKGAATTVFAARGPEGNDVAVKVLSHEVPEQLEFSEGFLKEVEKVGKLQHPSIVRLQDLGHDERLDRIYFVTELVRGDDAETLVHEGRASVELALLLAADVCSALAHAHGKGVIHRNLEPPDIMLCPLEDGTVTARILDFGLAQIIAATGLDPSDGKSQSVAYRSPEQIRGGEPDARTDIYTLGVILYEMLAGHMPFQGADEEALTQAILEGDVPPLDGLVQEVPQPLSALVGRMMSVDPLRRPRSAIVLLEQIDGLHNRLKLQPFLVKHEGSAHDPMTDWRLRRRVPVPVRAPVQLPRNQPATAPPPGLGNAASNAQATGSLGGARSGASHGAARSTAPRRSGGQVVGGPSSGQRGGPQQSVDGQRSSDPSAGPTGSAVSPDGVGPSMRAVARQPASPGRASDNAGDVSESRSPSGSRGGAELSGLPSDADTTQPSSAVDWQPSRKRGWFGVVLVLAIGAAAGYYLFGMGGLAQLAPMKEAVTTPKSAEPEPASPRPNDAPEPVTDESNPSEAPDDGTTEDVVGDNVRDEEPTKTDESGEEETGPDGDKPDELEFIP